MRSPPLSRAGLVLSCPGQLSEIPKYGDEVPVNLLKRVFIKEMEHSAVLSGTHTSGRYVNDQHQGWPGVD